ncbi:MAG: iron-containing alcohol dehydrogenase [Bacillales bacterium]|jgi:alcohol dehydrogenase YqhD (iron-dependent ADH family)|nr:iron-containing alcohol dehydrogenase [Bacillales bacterium]
MLNFNYQSKTRMIFGKGEEEKIGQYLRAYTDIKKVLLHYGSQSIKRTGLYQKVLNSLQKEGIEIVELGGVVPNPRISLVREGIKMAREAKVDLILAVGGGSVIDSGKAIAAGYYYEGDIWQAYSLDKAVSKALPVATILTIPAAGSESSNSSVITNDETNEKKGLHGSSMVPLLSIVNPELFFTLPKHQIAYGITDMMSHIFERYFSNSKDTALSDAISEAVLRTIIEYAPIVYNNPSNYHAWFQIGWAGTIAHNDLLGIGRVQDWATHGMEHQLSAYYDIAHGLGLAILTPAWMEYVYETNPQRFIDFALKVMGVEASGKSNEIIIKQGINKLRAFFNSLGLPSKLSKVGIDTSKFEIMASGCLWGTTIGNFKKLSKVDVLNIFNSVK